MQVLHPLRFLLYSGILFIEKAFSTHSTFKIIPIEITPILHYPSKIPFRSGSHLQTLWHEIPSPFLWSFNLGSLLFNLN